MKNRVLPTVALFMAVGAAATAARGQWKDLTKPEPELKSAAPEIAPRLTALTHSHPASVPKSLTFICGDRVLAINSEETAVEKKIRSSDRKRRRSSSGSIAASVAVADAAQANLSPPVGQDTRSTTSPTGNFVGPLTERARGGVLLMDPQSGRFYGECPDIGREWHEYEFVWFDKAGEKMLGLGRGGGMDASRL